MKTVKRMYTWTSVLFVIGAFSCVLLMVQIVCLLVCFQTCL